MLTYSPSPHCSTRLTLLMFAIVGNVNRSSSKRHSCAASIPAVIGAGILQRRAVFKTSLRGREKCCLPWRCRRHLGSSVTRRTNVLFLCLSWDFWQFLSSNTKAGVGPYDCHPATQKPNKLWCECTAFFEAWMLPSEAWCAPNLQTETTEKLSEIWIQHRSKNLPKKEVMSQVVTIKKTSCTSLHLIVMMLPITV